MTLPRRIVLVKGEDGTYDLPETAKYIGRPVFKAKNQPPLLWGSPFRNPHGCGRPCRAKECKGTEHTPEDAQKLYRRMLAIKPRLIQVAVEWADKGYDFACRCPEDYPCHGDVIIDVVAIYRWLHRDGRTPSRTELRRAIDPDGYAEDVAAYRARRSKKRAAA